MNGELVHIVGCPHPLRTHRVESFVVAGQTLEQIVEKGLRDLDVPSCMWWYGHAYVGDVYIPREQWASTVPQPGVLVTYRIVPQGKNPIKALLSIVVIAVASYFGNAVTGLFAKGSLLGALAGAATTTAITALGMLAVNSMFPIKQATIDTKDSEKESNTYSLAGSTNQISKFGAVPVLLGRHRVTPPQAALPYTELSGDDQYVMQLFCLGYTGIEIESNIRVGETDIADYDEFSVEIIEGAVSGAEPKYYQNDVYETSLAIELKEVDGWNTRTTDQPGNTFSIDLVAPNGLVAYSTSDGSKRNCSVDLEARWRVHDTETWFDLGGSTHAVQTIQFNFGYTTDRVYYKIYVSTEGSVKLTQSMDVQQGFEIVKFSVKRKVISNVEDLRKPGKYSGLSIVYAPPSSTDGDNPGYVIVTSGTCFLPLTSFIAAQTKAIRRTVTPGKISETPVYFDVAVRRITKDSTSSSVSDSFSWATLRSVNYRSPIGKTKPIDLISIRVKATGELTGTIDQLNFDGVSVCKDWDYETQTWVERATNNNASLFRFVLQHPANAKPKPDSAIDLEKLQEWHDFCRLKGLSYNRYIDYRTSVSAVLKEIAAAGLASVDRPDGLWSVIIERPRDTIKQLFTPRNSWNFKASRAFPEMPHGWRVTFNNQEAEYQADEMFVFADGYDESTAELFEGIEFSGVTDPAQIIKLGRQCYADALLCREEYQFEADFEHLVCKRGDRIRCANPVTMWGVSQGRVKSVDAATQTVVVDEPCPMQAGEAYFIIWRDETGAQHSRLVVLQVGEHMVLLLSGDGSLPSKGDLYAFGGAVDLVVKQIVDRGEQLSARIICKDYVPEVFDAVDRELPDYNTNITRPYAIVPVPPPMITQVQSTATVVNGLVSTFIYISATAPDGEQLQVQYRTTGGTAWVDCGRVDIAVGAMQITQVADFETYEVRVRTVKGLRTSNWVTVLHTYSLKTALAAIAAAWGASDSGFAVAAQGGMVNFSWATKQNIGGYEIRYGVDWETGVPIASGITGNVWAWQPTNSGSLNFYLKGVVVPGVLTDQTATAGLSVTPPSIAGVSAQVVGSNVLLSWSNIPGTYAIDKVIVRRGIEYASAEEVGIVGGTFSSLFETVAGTYKYWIEPVDKAGLRGGSVGVYAVVNQPAGYVLLAKTPLAWTGTKTSLHLESGLLYGPINTSETWEDHFVNNNFSSPQEQIEAGYPLFLQPGLPTASYVEIVDQGAVVSGCVVTLALTRDSVGGTITVVPQLSVSEDQLTWTDAEPGAYSFFANNFRYIKVTLNINTADHGILVIHEGFVTLDMQQKTITGSVQALAADILGTEISLSGFVDIQHISLSVVGSDPVQAYCDYEDVGNPTTGYVFARSSDGSRVDATVKYTITGV